VAAKAAKTSSSKFETTASTPQPRTFTRTASKASSSLPYSVRSSVISFAYRIRRNRRLKVSVSEATTSRPR